jgi:hypothetical protein
MDMTAVYSSPLWTIMNQSVLDDVICTSCKYGHAQIVKLLLNDFGESVSSSPDRGGMYESEVSKLLSFF